MRVPFVDLKAGVQAHREEYLAAITEVMDSAHFAGGPRVEAFEKEFASYCGAEHAVAVATGTDALILALRGCGIGPGDEVITAANSFFATAEAISHVGASPVFVDVDDVHLLIDPAQVEAAITERTRAVLPVHLFGQMADMRALQEIATRHGIVLLEDSAQAHGATRDGLRAGSVGMAAGFSFYPAKNLGAFGEGGAITAHDPLLVERLRCLRDHGQSGKHNHVEVGYNARLSSMLCAALRVGLRYLDEANAGRRAAAAHYQAALADLSGVRVVPQAGESVFHLFVVRVAERDRVASALAELGIGTGVHYPVPIHLQPAYAALGHTRGHAPRAEAAADEILSLPMYATLGEAQVRVVVGALRSVL